ncbi:MAG: hypothetical protein HC835_17390 [Oscillatoriales cyanobacterium RM2_1_1]|nr:hypothetical protein [Oscillatoriales cyanobacterium SM2_3_0]NJO47243.1 hypothetical protein [Oscillatoriales cyanobacterium RM2_1_1]
MLTKAIELKQKLIDFLYDAEGDLAIALERYAAQHGEHEHRDLRYQNLVVDTFLVEGEVGGEIPLAIFLQDYSDLEVEEKSLIKSWEKTFTGLFEILQIEVPRLDLKNWLTDKEYSVFLTAEVSEIEVKRWQPGEILLTRIAPLDAKTWMLSGACIPKGKLSKPKLAVAIGEFQKKYKNSLYGDAPELLEQAWKSVAYYDQNFVDFFGSDQVALPGYQLNQKIAELQNQLVQQQLESAGIDSSKSMQELVNEAGADEVEFELAAIEAGADTKIIERVMKDKLSTMTTPKVELPEDIRRAEKVTVFSHPHWGQMFVPSYSQFVDVLNNKKLQEEIDTTKLVLKYLKDPKINTFIWYRLREKYPDQLERALQIALHRPDLSLNQDLDSILQEFNKPLKPDLPEIASIPKHLNDLFEQAVAQVSLSKTTSKSKSESKLKSKNGFNKKKSIQGFKA